MNTQFRKWSSEEEDQLLKEISEGMAIYAISRVHSRSKKAIELRLLDISIRLLDDGLPYSDIFNKTKCTEEQIKLRKLQLEEENTKKLSKNHPDCPFRQIETPQETTILQILKDLSHDVKELKAQLSK